MPGPPKASWTKRDGKPARGAEIHRGIVKRMKMTFCVGKKEMGDRQGSFLRAYGASAYETPSTTVRRSASSDRDATGARLRHSLDPDKFHEIPRKRGYTNQGNTQPPGNITDIGRVRCTGRLSYGFVRARVDPTNGLASRRCSRRNSQIQGNL
jgi:hypothetical protein